jgi:translation initiation factor 1
MASRSSAKTVYSSEQGRICSHCGLPSKRCQCRANPRGLPSIANSDGDGVARVGRTSKGRGGKTVTTITGLQLPPDELRALTKALKQCCGTGGAVKDDVIEIQGDQRDTLVRELEDRGYRVKRTGG